MGATLCSVRASHCSGFSGYRAPALEHAGFSSCGSRALEHKLRSCGPQHVGCVIRCSIACGIFSNQQSKPRLLHWQEDSLPLSYQGSPAAAAAAKSLQSRPTLTIPWTAAHQAPLSMGFPRQQYWSGLPFHSQGIFSKPGIKPASPALVGRFFTS